jgi:ABC-type phosphate transport system substrate-binding protein
MYRRSVDIGNMSRDLKDSEKSDTIVDTVVAIDELQSL